MPLGTAFADSFLRAQAQQIQKALALAEQEMAQENLRMRQKEHEESIQVRRFNQEEAARRNRAAEEDRDAERERKIQADKDRAEERAFAAAGTVIKNTGNRNAAYALLKDASPDLFKAITEGGASSMNAQRRAEIAPQVPQLLQQGIQQQAPMLPEMIGNPLGMLGAMGGQGLPALQPLQQAMQPATPQDWLNQPDPGFVMDQKLQQARVSKMEADMKVAADREERLGKHQAKMAKIAADRETRMKAHEDWKKEVDKAVLGFRERTTKVAESNVKLRTRELNFRTNPVAGTYARQMHGLLRSLGARSAGATKDYYEVKADLQEAERWESAIREGKIAPPMAVGGFPPTDAEVRRYDEAVTKAGLVPMLREELAKLEAEMKDANAQAQQVKDRMAEVGAYNPPAKTPTARKVEAGSTVTKLIEKYRYR